ncbi:MAG: hypothetical protein GFH27_549291n332 [Chloroflexi bacterium AL-W]|nr:hypothetical protein [Chloroflexi bacterium AL-N1]NOK67200.1 hypothetical protein [Chloroflexi bacterium AL-N10]NOK75306.1 hypothetical protein [Chloroflexi bacterium AL-N5]NOK82094.1 hypothetical protein [Chloroflexi bacterium AL-W]NOK89939.1 hypothetical protein [Chloroflexi bacterium AL-N15]
MKKTQPINMYIGMLCCLIVSGCILSFPGFLGAQSSALPILTNDVHTGEGTFYAATGAGSCSFDPTPDNLMVAAMNETDYDTARLCGAYVEATGPEGTVVVRIVDLCPGCKSGDIDFSAEAFALIADPDDGRVPISWRIVSPELDGPIVYRYKEGSSQYWTAVQIRNHRNPIATFEYETSDGQFTPVPRTGFNYFIQQGGMGSGPYTFRVTDIYENVITDSNIPLIDSGEVSSSSQFPDPIDEPEPTTPPTEVPTGTAVPPTEVPSVTPTDTPVIPTPPADASTWQPNTSYAVGEEVTYEGSTYRCLQAHTSLSNWQPSSVPALWQLVA